MKHTFDKTEGIFYKNKVLFDKKKWIKKKKICESKNLTMKHTFDKNKVFFYKKGNIFDNGSN